MERSLKDLVERHFRVYEHRRETVATGLTAEAFHILLRDGDLVDFDTAYAAFQADLKALDPELVSMYRHHLGEDLLLIADKPPVPPVKVGLHVGLLLATILTTVVGGAIFAAGFTDPAGTSGTSIWDQENLIRGALWFALPLMLILGIHEMAHFVAARRHGLRATPPFFIPFPPLGLPIGTLGAFISLRDPMPDRKALFDVGASGPLAGFAVAIPVVILGALLTQGAAVAIPDLATPILDESPWYDVSWGENGHATLTFSMDALSGGFNASSNQPGTGEAADAQSNGTIIPWRVTAPDGDRDWTVAATLFVTRGDDVDEVSFTRTLEPGQSEARTVTLPADTTAARLELDWDDGLVSFGDPLLLLALDQWIGNDDYLSHPTFIAGWVGLLLTGINLLPAGQLDGGHVARAVLGERTRYAAYAAVGLLFFLGLQFSSWLLMAAFVLFTGIHHPPPMNDRTGLGPGRRIIAGVVVAVLLLTFVPIPIQI